MLSKEEIDSVISPFLEKIMKSMMFGAWTDKKQKMLENNVSVISQAIFDKQEGLNDR